MYPVVFVIFEYVIHNFLNFFLILIMPARRHVKVNEDSVTPRKKSKLSQKRLDALIHIPSTNIKFENLDQAPLDLSDSRTEIKRQELLLWVCSPCFSR